MPIDVIRTRCDASTPTRADSTSRVRAPRWIAAAGLVALVAACEARPAVEVSVATGSSARDLVFVVHRRAGGHVAVRSLRVLRSRKAPSGTGGDAISLWVAAPTHGSVATLATDSIRYGLVPAGFTGTVPAPLLAGTYRLDVVDAAGVHASTWSS